MSHLRAFLLRLLPALLLLGSVRLAQADDQGRANQARIAIDEATRQANSLRTAMGEAAWTRVQGDLQQLQSLRSSIWTNAQAVGNTESALDSLATHVQRLRIEAESAVAQHNLAVGAHNNEMRSIEREAISLSNRIAQHNATRDQPRTREQVIAYDALARALNNEVWQLKQREAAILARNSASITRLSVAASAKEREWVGARADALRRFEAFEQLRRGLHADIDQVIAVLERLPGVVNAAILDQAGHHAELAKDTARRPVGTPRAPIAGAGSAGGSGSGADSAAAPR